jgi:ADP-ribose pyrophosphatase
MSIPPPSDPSSFETLFQGAHLRVVRRGHWESVDRMGITGIVAIVALTHAGRILLIEQDRPPVDARVIELPAGLVGDVAGTEAETLEEAARRELLEETGYEANEWTWLTEGPPSAGLSSERIAFFLAGRLVKTGPGGGDATEDIRLHEVPLDRAFAWLEDRRRSGLLVDPKVFAALYFAGRKESSSTNGPE